jgi:hypothetical protein
MTVIINGLYKNLVAYGQLKRLLKANTGSADQSIGINNMVESG